ncbi:MAG: hypothetical protein ABI581_12005 [Sediminibacterium sp.]
MKTSFRFYIFLILPALFFSCQKKYLTAIILNATGTLKTSNGDCLPKTVGGTYIAGKQMGDTNFVFITVDIKTTGRYNIKTDEVNGYSFASAGELTQTGPKQIRLIAKGKPLVTGVNDFLVSFDTDTCHFKITVGQFGGSPPSAEFNLTGSPNSCINAVVTGAYANGNTLDTSNKVTLGVTVTTPGNYSFSTNTVNGYKFSVSGNFANSGQQNIVLVATGKPILNGTDNFTVSGGASFCSFPVTVLTPQVTLNNDLFPLTYGSYTTYGDAVPNPVDSLKRTIIDSVVTNGSLYFILEEKSKVGTPTQSLYRKAANVYYEYASVDKYTSSFKYGPEIKKDIPVLKDSLTTGDTWSSDEYIGTATFGQKIYFKYDMFCIAGNVAATVNGKTFGNVCKIVIAPMIRSDVFFPFASTGERIELWYAKGVGLIYSKKTNTFSTFEWFLRYWMIK